MNVLLGGMKEMYIPFNFVAYHLTKILLIFSFYDYKEKLKLNFFQIQMQREP